MKAIELATMLAPKRSGSGSSVKASETSRCVVTSVRRSISASAVGETSPPTRRASSAVTRAASSGSAAACAAPLCVIALANRPLAAGRASRVVTLIAPADSPKTVTRSGSPPKAAMFSRTQRRAASWSRIPRFAGTPGSSANPSTPSR
jgi:hypothetical protein